MMRQMARFALACMAVVYAALPVPAQDPGGGLGRAAPVPPDHFGGLSSGGVVVAVGKDSITIDGGCTIDGNNRPRTTYPVSAVLAAGGVDRNGIASEVYRLSDVRVGDKVDLFGHRVNGICTCTRISIRRRPGGRVPPSQDSETWARFRYHEYANALQDFEEKGIPVPDRFKPKPPPNPPPRRIPAKPADAPKPDGLPAPLPPTAE
jgi:hypothetical protein